MRNLTVWTLSEITKLFGTINEPFFIEKICRFIGRSVNDVLSKLLNMGLCEINYKDNKISTARNTNLNHLIPHSSFIPKLLELGWIYELSNREESLKAPKWWVSNDQFPMSNTNDLNRNETVWVNEEIHTVISMIQNKMNLSSIADKIHRNQSSITTMLMDLGILECIDKQEIFLSEVNEVKLSKYTFNNALVLINHGWVVTSNNLHAPNWWLENNKDNDNVHNNHCNESEKITGSDSRQLYMFVKTELEGILNTIHENKRIDELSDVTYLGYTLSDLTTYIGITSVRAGQLTRNNKIHMSYFMDKPYNIKKILINFGWKVSEDLLAAPEWWSNEE
ncbi:hypothetical protein WMR86_19475 (plasmid) [Proteus vulgaris]|uniref:Uncharacterized protein n=2 Tax=Morganellaceae TaxID=1903414 RepID=A0A3S7EAU2_MORMO|nr:MULTISPECIES: hypothetical protein [Morganellaceae]AVA19436.1 hypothetical protein [Morganella morganii]MCX2589673.1 hypothetical protein [Proteus penneri]MDH2324441.1 hypothetical protein [Providencia rettgeri]MDL9989278.1 hypothetical protein [Providencia rettgeri]QIF96421.1 hypothetical protein GTH24_21190 [Proteus vulgaris]